MSSVQPSGMDESASIVESTLSAPSNLVVSEATETAVALSWRAASRDAVAYVVWRGDANWANWIPVAEVPSSTRSFRDTSVVPGATYTYGVRALNRAGAPSDSSNIVRVTAGEPATAPAPDADPFRQRVPSSPVLHSRSADLVQQLASNRPTVTAEFGTAIYSATESDPLCTFTFANSGAWGVPWTETIRVPAAAMATGWASGDPWGDHWLSIRYNGAQYDIWYFDLWTGEACGADGNGRATHGAKYSFPGALLKPFQGGTGSGSGISVTAGAPTRSEIAGDAIDHALNLVVTFESPEFKFPAWKADGDCRSGICAKAGQRFYLDVSDADINAISHPAQRALARALQRYGAYVTDKTADNNIPIEQNARDLFPWDFYELDEIPWTRMKALKCWDGTDQCAE